MKITIYGAGIFGTALGKILEANGHQILYYNHGSNISSKEATDFGEIIVLAVPSQAIPGVIQLLPQNKPLIVATKGILSLKPFKNFTDISFLSGGAFAADLNHKLKTTLTATSPIIPKLFQNDWLTFELTDDKTGVALCGSFKNIYAIYAGYQSVASSPEKRADLIQSSLKEIKKIIKANGGNPKTANLACGLGDLKTTFSPTSRNYRFGKNLKKDINFAPEGTIEGFSAFKNLPKTDIIIPDNLPIFNEIKKLLSERS